MKMFMDRAKVEMMKKLYKKGERIVCDFMDDPQGVPSGTEGTITSVDDIGQIDFYLNRFVALFAYND